MSRITDVQIRNWIKTKKVIPGIRQGEVPGLTFTLSKSGIASWILRFRFDGKAEELTIGRYPDFLISDAKTEALEARKKIQQGINVAREKKLKKIKRAALKQLDELAKDYMEKRFPYLSPSTARQRKQHIENIILPKLGRIIAKEVTSAEIVDLIRKVGERSIHVAELVMTALSEIFKHGIGNHAVTANPCSVITIAAICGQPPPPRQRIMLTESEIKTIFSELSSIGSANTLATKILLATCVRTGELSRAKWEEIDFELKRWWVPDSNSKGKKGFCVPLAQPVISWLSELKKLSGNSAYLLPARQKSRAQRLGGDAPYEQRSLNAMLTKLNIRIKDKVRKFTPHDFRSTARSHLELMGVSTVVAERALNHKIGGLHDVYMKHDYLEERSEALENWAKFLASCQKITTEDKQ